MDTGANDNPVSAYNPGSKVLHWAIAVFILCLLCVGFYMVSMDFSPLKLQIYGFHKSFGMTVLVLAALRILWRSLTASPPPLNSHATWEKTLSKIIHILLYVGMIGMPLSGWAMSSAGDFPNVFFGLFEIPHIMDKDEAWFEILKQIHEYMALALIGGVGLHLAGALKHHFIDQDMTLKRMVGDVGTMGGGLIGLIAAVFLVSASSLYLSQKGFFDEGAPHFQQEIAQDEIEDEVSSGWQIDLSQSEIGFTATQYGAAFDGSFSRFGGEIIFDPDNLNEAYARIEIDITSIQTGAEDRDKQALGEDWFFAEKFSKAIFEASQFYKDESGGYIADGSLTIREQKQPLSLPFTVDFKRGDDGQQVAEMQAILTLNRLEYGVGQGQWANGEAIGDTVKLDIYVRAIQP